MTKEKTIALTGSAGHIASALMPLLSAGGYRIKALVYHQEPDCQFSNIQWIKGDLSDQASLDQLVDGCGVVIHCAARISLYSNRDPLLYDINVNGTRRLFTAALGAGVRRFIHISSIHAYDQLAAGAVLNEESPYCADVAPCYDRSKRDAQQWVLREPFDGMEVLVLNPTAVVGPFDRKPSLMGRAIMDIYLGRIPALIRGGFDFVDVRDVASAILSAMEKGRHGEAYLLPGHWHSLDDLQRIIHEISGKGKRLPVLPAWAGTFGLPFVQAHSRLTGREPLYTQESLLALTQGHRRISGLKASAELGYRARPLKETVADTIGWFHQNGLIN